MDSYEDAWIVDPARLDSIESRLFDLRGLARKHRVEPAQLGALYREMTAKLTRMAAGEEGLHQLEADLAAKAGAYRAAAEKLTGQRREAARRIDHAVAPEMAARKQDAQRIRPPANPPPKNEVTEKG